MVVPDDRRARRIADDDFLLLIEVVGHVVEPKGREQATTWGYKAARPSSLPGFLRSGDVEDAPKPGGQSKISSVVHHEDRDARPCAPRPVAEV